MCVIFITGETWKRTSTEIIQAPWRFYRSKYGMASRNHESWTSVYVTEYISMWKSLVVAEYHFQSLFLISGSYSSFTEVIFQAWIEHQLDHIAAHDLLIWKKVNSGHCLILQSSSIRLRMKEQTYLYTSYRRALF